MSEAAREAHVTLKLCICDMCGVAFGIPAELFDRLVAYRGVVCCPSGHVRPMIRQLEVLVAEHGARLVAVNEENAQLRRAIVDRLVGPETASDTTP